MRLKTINPSLRKDTTYQVTFRHPLHSHAPKTYSLSTRDEAIANLICSDLVKLCISPDVGQDPHSPRLLAYDPRAVEIFFGVEVANRLKEKREKPSLDVTEIATLGARLCGRLGIVKGTPNYHVVHEALAEYEANRWKKMNEQCEQLEKLVTALRPENEAMKSQLAQYARENNAHVKISIEKAFEKFKVNYAKHHKRRTVKDVEATVEHFIASLKDAGRFSLALVRAEQVNAWIDSLSGVEGQNLSAQTLQRRKAYVSTFFSWAQKQYDLSEHPVKKSMTITGATRPPENIEALSLIQINELIKGLKPHPYWQAWVSVAVLAGLRWGEQVNLPLEAVNLADNYITIRASKTGRQRRVPIEQTTLLPILKRYVRSCEGKEQRLLFPNIAPPHLYMERTVTVADVWSSARVWHTHFDSVKPAGVVFGPREWRHTFGTALGQSGMSGVEIARLMGNSPEVADKHYIAVSEAGKRWPFKW